MTKEHDYSISVVADITGRHPETLRVLARKGQLPGAYKLGEQWLVNRQEFEKHRGGELAPEAA